jgi:4-amino-4-deoxy-L-arabinose transferase-like glycosyltransferase
MTSIRTIRDAAGQTGPDTGAGAAGSAVRGAALARFDRRVLGIAAIAFAVLMAFSARYGFLQDELYFLDCARHLQASYVDQPVLGPLLARVSLDLFGVSAPGLRVWPALAVAGTVVIGGLTAREFGGGRRAQLIAAAGTAVMPVLLGAGHIANTTPYLLFTWAALALIVVRIGRTGDSRWWLAAGLALGLGLTDNYLIGSFAVAVVIGILICGGWRLVCNRWFAAGLVIAVAFTVPAIWWQSQHGWAVFAMTRQLNRENGGLGNIPSWIFGQLTNAGVPMIPVWLAGLRFLRKSELPVWRALVWAYGLLFVVFAITAGAQNYYLSAAYIYLVGAGAPIADRWLSEETGRLRQALVPASIVTLISAAIALPVLPASDIGWTLGLNRDLAQTVGWPQVVQTVRGVWTSLPAKQRASTVIFTADYGEAGAINELGLGTGLPEAVSGQNTDWWWGPGNPHATTVIAVMTGKPQAIAYMAHFSRFFASVRQVGTLTNPYGVHNPEWGGKVYLCTGPHQPWAQIWPQLRHYD